jgi:periplasmic divalent cation tolerance protein
MTGHLTVLCTCPDAETARHLAEQLVERQQAACVNIISGISSVYQWQGRRESAEELLLIIKTREDSYNALQQSILEMHPYELPEIIAVPIITGFSPYLEWIDAHCKTDS